ncbi:MAG: fibrobacter succinogenes major paralogous domain-containing protein [Dysgonamonadaceae bacterium]|jgi:hypothetical protein|nr:fibrobacter succinogenes major paralogous domain-containing protein [Dysgonamonadaceae bacterium]
MKMTKKTIFLLLLFLMVLETVNVNAQVRIGGDTPPNASAVLDLNPDSVSNASGGLLLPRVSLTAVDDPNPFLSHEKGLMVYNRATGNVEEGIYYNDGEKWHPVLSSAPVGGLELPIIFLRQPGKVWLGDTGSLIDTMYVELLEKDATTTFQWYKRDSGLPPTPVDGETSDTLFIDKTKLALGLNTLGKVSQFFCLVRNGSQTAVSSSGYAVYGSGAWLADGKWINIAPANLGADQTKTVAWQMAHVPVGSAPTSNPLYEDSVYGDWYQWGRQKDDHQRRNTTTIYGSHLNSVAGIGCHPDSLDSNGQIQRSLIDIYDKFILRDGGGANDWRQYSEDAGNTITSPVDAWTWANATNDPCKGPMSSLPLGFAWRVPSQLEWTQIRQNNTWVWHVSSISGYEIKPGGAAKPTSLFLPTGGFRTRSGGGANATGSNGLYWSSTVTSTVSYALFFSNENISVIYTSPRANGLAIRCVSEY